MKKIQKFTLSALMCSCLALPANNAYAQQKSSADKTSTAAEEEEDKYKNFDMETLAELYWKVGRPDLEERKDLDNFMKITQCSLYNEYHQNEFEWQQIREAAKSYLKDQSKKFPVHFQFMQPLKLGEYNIKEEYFEIQEKYQLKGTRRFEVVVRENGEKVCDDGGKIPGYPGSIGVQFSRPVGLTDVPVKRDLAETYIAEKQEAFKKLNSIDQTQEKLMAMREAYIVMKVKFFSSQGTAKNEDGSSLPLLLANLERIEIYADQEKETLLMARNMTKRKRAALPSLVKEKSKEEDK